MKRSTINRAILETISVTKKYNFALPEFAYWTMEEWRKNKDGIGEIAKLMLGWDVTDFGAGQFETRGAVLFTLRNGDILDPSFGVPYAEKIIYVDYRTEQEIPFHYHATKTEDIINRAGGTLMLELYNHTPDNQLDRNRDVLVKMDGVLHTFAPGEFVRVKPGKSITLPPGLFHRFWSCKDTGETVIGEVSSINDDNNDNTFLDRIQRFSKIEEDEAVLYPLCNEYDTLLF